MPSKVKAQSSLLEFVASVKAARKPPCLLCTIPQRAEIDRAYSDGSASQPVIRKWLVETHGHPSSQLTKSKLEDHFQDHVVKPLKHRLKKVA